MNELTEALAKQAAEYAIEFATQDQSLYIPKLMEKFAELIVQECINCCDEVDRINKAYIEKLQFDPENGPKECIQVIKEHFGVEE